MSNDQTPRKAPWGEGSHRSRLLTYSLVAIMCVALAVCSALGVFGDSPNRFGALGMGVIGAVFFMFRVIAELRRR